RTDAGELAVGGDPDAPRPVQRFRPLEPDQRRGRRRPGRIAALAAARRAEPESPRLPRRRRHPDTFLRPVSLADPPAWNPRRVVLRRPLDGPGGGDDGRLFVGPAGGARPGFGGPVQRGASI